LVAFMLTGMQVGEVNGRRSLMYLGLAEMAGLAVQGDDAPGTLSALLPLTCTLAAVGIYKVWRRALALGWSAVAASAAGAVLLFQMCWPLSYPPGRFAERSLIRLRYLTGQAPYRAREMLENELYNSKQYSITNSRRVAATLRERAVTIREVWIDGDEPQVLWLLDGAPAQRFLRPVPPWLATQAEGLVEQARQASELARPRCLVSSHPGPAESVSPGMFELAHRGYVLLAAFDSLSVACRNYRNDIATEDVGFFAAPRQ
jgi:hypothetical protein